MPDVLIIGDTERMFDLRHVVPVQVTDAFVYGEVSGQRVIAIFNFEIERIREAGVEAEFRPMEHYKPEEVARETSDAYSFRNELHLRAVRDLGITSAVVPRCFPVGLADHLRANGIELEVDQRFFDDRRRVKSSHELAGIRRAQKAAEAGMAAARELLQRAEVRNGGYAVDGRELTCELIKQHVERAFADLGSTTDEFIVSHGPQTA